MRDIDAELDRRLIEGPSDSFIGFTDEELQELFTRRSNEFKEVVGAIEVLKSFGERDSEGAQSKERPESPSISFQVQTAIHPPSTWHRLPPT